MSDKQEITKENLRDLDIKAIATDPDLGKYNFEHLYDELEALRSLFVELEDLKYQEKLSDDEVNTVNNQTEEFIKRLKNIQDFAGSSELTDPRHQNIEKDIRNFHNNAFKNLRTILIYLRQEAEREITQPEKVQKKAREYEDLVGKLQSRLDELEKKQKEIATAPGEVAATRFGRHFEELSAAYQKSATEEWLPRRGTFFKWLLGIVVANLIAYIVLLVLPELTPSDLFTLEYGLLKLGLISLLVYGLSFSSRNYRINENLAIANKHRQKTADSLMEFYSMDLPESVRAELIRQGTAPMFQHLDTGHVGKSSNSDDGMVQKVINNVLDSKEQ